MVVVKEVLELPSRALSAFILIETHPDREAACERKTAPTCLTCLAPTAQACPRIAARGAVAGGVVDARCHAQEHALGPGVACAWLTAWDARPRWPHADEPVAGAGRRGARAKAIRLVAPSLCARTPLRQARLGLSTCLQPREHTTSTPRALPSLEHVLTDRQEQRQASKDKRTSAVPIRPRTPSTPLPSPSLTPAGGARALGVGSRAHDDLVALDEELGPERAGKKHQAAAVAGAAVWWLRR
jgi:hypothetical protein